MKFSLPVNVLVKHGRPGRRGKDTIHVFRLVGPPFCQSTLRSVEASRSSSIHRFGLEVTDGYWILRFGRPQPPFIIIARICTMILYQPLDSRLTKSPPVHYYCPAAALQLVWSRTEISPFISPSLDFSHPTGQEHCPLGTVGVQVLDSGGRNQNESLTWYHLAI